ncbi:signal recognition particle-docking protein FtsY [Candidatus Woesearchaeota archaeon]|nr:signal recognition particle-docking protein FtsY [Candidatus Woesearchaeota archaeon]
MFKFLKTKIKDAVGKFTKSAEEEAETAEQLEGSQGAEETEQQQEAPQEKTSEEKPVVQPEEKQEEKIEKPIADSEPEPEPEPEPVISDQGSEKEASEEKQEAQDPESIEEVEEIKEDVKRQEEINENQEELHSQPEEKSETEESVEELALEETSEPEPEAEESVEEVKEELALEIKEELAKEETQTAPEEQELTTEEEVDEYEETGKKKRFLGNLFRKKDKEEKIEEKSKEPVFEPKPEEEKQEPVSKPEVEGVKEEPALEHKKEAKPVIEETSEPEPEPEPEPEVEEVKEVVVEAESDLQDADGPKSRKEAAHKELLEETTQDTTKKKKGFFGKLKERVVKFQLTEEKFEEIFWEFELALLENNVAVQVIEKIKKDMHEQLTQENVTRKSVEEVIIDTLKNSLKEILDVPAFDLLSNIKTKKPYVICMTGVNGSGKTTTLAKLIHYFQKNNISLVVAAADTFRAAAIQQLEEHTNKLGVKLIKHDYNADPAAVAFDAIKHATAKGLDVVLIDTAGRLQSNSNLMDELKKLIRVNKPDLNIFIGESITGNDCVEQAVAFNEAVGIDGIILSKADVDDKGGAAISVSYVTGKPILYLGTGQTYDDLEVFDKEKILANLGL